MRYALGVEYDGGGFQGWQGLGPSGPSTVQATLERALSSVADQAITVSCAGRTDAGVHAECQVVHFDSTAERDPRAWTLGVTGRLPPTVCVRWCMPVDDAFHARFSARARRYRYTLVNRPVRPALYRSTMAWERRPLDADAMHRAAQALLGENDFSAFRTVHCQAPHARRNLQDIQVRRSGETVSIEVQANAFLHHMVRNIVGSLLEVGAGARDEGWIARLLAGRDRTLAGPTAAPQGLVFLRPLYPAEWGLPEEVTL
ncbi:tRNA pseudouridine synthase A [Pseudoxanthomonas suwonensis 11-1]|uniref:tRNA pseudouridine synthase A n=1 Tax=Pseudoxanthomonas suwonensis (strain 11-1) TaxID=743721 RepID=E6WU62_PSEUU|nr:tRNA pseudouridine(38-40) synthase TruA [Pseudoxanthomonas suwonensis]ADV27782.1 tRNA pseudouridine synthase A [Pseudoxanthomonas suwonensis 11-1]